MTIIIAYRNYEGVVRQFTVRGCADPAAACSMLEGILDTTVGWVAS